MEEIEQLVLDLPQHVAPADPGSPSRQRRVDAGG
jgi:hypothetical protein